MTAKPADADRIGLNEPQQRHLLVSCQYVDKLLSSIEAILSASRSSSPFPRYCTALTPVQARLAADYLARIRSRLVRVLESQGIPIPPPQVDALFAIRTALTFADNAVEELRPKYMRGYGGLPDALQADVDGVVDELRTVLHRLDDYLAQDSSRGLEMRIERLEAGSGETEALRTIERVITARGLVEFRPTLAMVVDRLVSPTFEIAVFGRVSSGKSSLLNRILGAAVLPVGVTPITAVPTRLIYGEPPGLTASFADAPMVTAALDLLPQLVTEHLNPGNRRHVTRVDVRYPSPRLEHGVVLVDTPGLGSLATAGADETLAYLPRCDLGIVLIDAGSTLMPDDVMTVQALVHAGTPASVLLSKADLLGSDDRARAAAYIAEHIRAEVGLDVAVHAVSAIGADATLTDTWFAAEIAPICQRHQEVALHSIHRKIVLLRDAVRASLQATADRGAGRVLVSTESLADAETALRRAGALAANVKPMGEQATAAVAGGASVVVRQAAGLFVNGAQGAGLTVEDVRSALGRAAKDTVGAQAEGLRIALGRFAADLAAALAQAADALGRPDAPPATELLSRVRELPALVLPEVTRPLVVPGLAAVTRSLRIRAIERQLDAQIGQSLAAALSAFGVGLRGWMRDAVAEVQNGFHEYAEPLRTYIERTRATMPGSGDSSGTDVRAIREDLAALDRICGDGPPGDEARPVS
ncbi:MAG: dynamin family protein [Acidobacteria bacterium]|nr:dynamin family protein [Acidobacteriota bacterium]